MKFLSILCVSALHILAIKGLSKRQDEDHQKIKEALQPVINSFINYNKCNAKVCGSVVRPFECCPFFLVAYDSTNSNSNPVTLTVDSQSNSLVQFKTGNPSVFQLAADGFDLGVFMKKFFVYFIPTHVLNLYKVQILSTIPSHAQFRGKAWQLWNFVDIRDISGLQFNQISTWLFCNLDYNGIYLATVTARYKNCSSTHLYAIANGVPTTRS